jgi:hypothetical protein
LIIISAFTISVCVIFIICYGGQHMVNIVKQIELRCLYVLIYMLHHVISVGTDNIWPSPKIHSVLFHVSNYNTITTNPTKNLRRSQAPTNCKQFVLLICKCVQNYSFILHVLEMVCVVIVL